MFGFSEAVTLFALKQIRIPRGKAFNEFINLIFINLNYIYKKRKNN
jgi:hypothetical protein